MIGDLRCDQRPPPLHGHRHRVCCDHHHCHGVRVRQIKQPPVLTPRLLRTWRKSLGFTGRDLAHVVGRLHDRTVRKWESKEAPIPPEVQRLYQLLEWMPQPVRASAIAWLKTLPPFERE